MYCNLSCFHCSNW
uniref:Uncharacterized protein n=1 Tax=Rhizophora mucronata TaxID=61149 RepID=A0A2P2J4K2_RHIMU